MKSKILFLSLFLSGAASLQAQEEEKQVSMLIDFVSYGEDLSGLEVRSGKRGEPVKALAFSYSEPFKYTGSQILTLAFGEGFNDSVKKQAEDYERMKLALTAEDIKDLPPFVPNVNPEVEGKIPQDLALAREKDPGLAALVKLPTTSRRVTILLAPGPKRSLVPYIFDDDPTRHPLGTVRIHNLSKYPIALRTNSKTNIELLPTKNFLANATDGILTYELAYQTEGKWKIQENNMVNVGSNDQMHMLVLNNSSSFFTSSDGSKGGFMQIAFLRRTIKEE